MSFNSWLFAPGINWLLTAPMTDSWYAISWSIYSLLNSLPDNFLNFASCSVDCFANEFTNSLFWGVTPKRVTSFTAESKTDWWSVTILWANSLTFWLSERFKAILPAEISILLPPLRLLRYWRRLYYCPIYWMLLEHVHTQQRLDSIQQNRSFL